MSNHRLDEFILLVVILVLAGAASNNHVRAEGPAPCLEGLGACGAASSDCQDKCAAKHPGVKAQGSCDPGTSPPLCTCYFDCTPPAPKTCTGGAGLCSAKCGDQCCNTNCASKYSQGRGFCNMLGSTWLCQCEYSC